MIGHGTSESGVLFSLQEWTHIAAMGRDQYVRVVKRGFLFPFGHRAEVTQVAERKFKRSLEPGGEKPAFLTNTTFLTIQELERTYGTPDEPIRGMPFQSVR